jgi:hypothetical protein
MLSTNINYGLADLLNFPRSVSGVYSVLYHYNRLNYYHFNFTNCSVQFTCVFDQVTSIFTIIRTSELYRHHRLSLITPVLWRVQVGPVIKWRRFLPNR